MTLGSHILTLRTAANAHSPSPTLAYYNHFRQPLTAPLNRTKVLYNRTNAHSSPHHVIPSHTLTFNSTRCCIPSSAYRTLPLYITPQPHSSSTASSSLVPFYTVARYVHPPPSNVRRSAILRACSNRYTHSSTLPLTHSRLPSRSPARPLPRPALPGRPSLAGRACLTAPLPQPARVLVVRHTQSAHAAS